MSSAIFVDRNGRTRSKLAPAVFGMKTISWTNYHLMMRIMNLMKILMSTTYNLMWYKFFEIYIYIYTHYPTIDAATNDINFFGCMNAAGIYERKFCPFYCCGSKNIYIYIHSQSLVNK